MSYAVETQRLTKRFPQIKGYRELLLHPFRRRQTTVLEDVTIRVQEGELFGLLGPNGAGKTTLIKILCTLVLPNEGKAFVNGYDVAQDGKNIRKNIGYVISEERSFYWRLTGRQNLKFFATLNNIPPRLAERRIGEVVELTSLTSDIDKVFKDYSSGMKQKLAIARGMLTDPQILFLDEPTRTLDPIVTRDLRQFIKDHIVKERKRTVILATNNMREAEELCDRVAIIHRGRVRICDTLKGIRRVINNKDRYVLMLEGSAEQLQQHFSAASLADRVASLNREPSTGNGAIFRVELNSTNEHISDIIAGILHAGIRVESCHPQEDSLDDIFAKVID